MRLKDAKYRGVVTPPPTPPTPPLIPPTSPPTPTPTPVRVESRAYQAATPPGLRAEVYNKLEEKAKVTGFSIDIKAESLDATEKLGELLLELKAKGISGQIGVNLSIQSVSLSKNNIIDLINKIPMPVSETQLPADTVTLHLEVEIEEH